MACLTLGAPWLSAATFHVNATTGDNTRTALEAQDPSTPWKTITRAINETSLASGDTIQVAAGTYNSTLGESFPLFLVDGVQILGAGAASTTVVSTEFSPTFSNSNSLSSTTRLSGFKFMHEGSTGFFELVGFNVGANEVMAPRIDNNLFQAIAGANSETGIRYRDGFGDSQFTALIENNTFTGFNFGGISGVQTSGGTPADIYSPTIRNNTFDSNQFGIRINIGFGEVGGGGGTTAPIITDNMFDTSAADDIDVLFNLLPDFVRLAPTITNNTFTGTSGTAVSFDGVFESGNHTVDPTISNNIFIGPSTAVRFEVNAIGPTGNKTLAPLISGNSVSNTVGRAIEFDMSELSFDPTATLTFAPTVSNNSISAAGFHGADIDVSLSSGFNLSFNPIFTGNMITGSVGNGIHVDFRGNCCSSMFDFGITVANNTIDGSGQRGVDIFLTGLDGNTAGSLDLSLTGNQITNNIDSGLKVAASDYLDSQLAQTVLISNNTLTGNGVNGITLTLQSQTSLVSNDVRITNNNLSSNTSTGLTLLSEDWQPGGVLTNAVLVSCNTMTGNGGLGALQQSANGPPADFGGGNKSSPGFNQIFGNSFTFDLANFDTEPMKAENNWWGSTDPATIDSRILDDDEGAFGAVDFDPFLMSAQSCADADLSITKTDDPDPVTAGGNLLYTLTVANAGPAAASSVVVTDTLPPGVTFLGATGAFCSESAGTVTCTTASIPAGGTVTITISVTAPSSSGVIINSASVTASSPDPNSANNSDSESTTVTADADLSIVKTDSPDPVAAGGTLTYTLTIGNAGPAGASSVVVTDTLPPGVTFLSASGPGASCTESGGIVTCTVASIPAGGSVMITIAVTAPASGGTITNSATVSSASPDPNSSNNSAAQSTTVLAPSAGQADLSVFKFATPDPVVARSVMTYHVNVDNNGPDAAVNIVIEDRLPVGMSFLSAEGDGWNCLFDGTFVICQRAALAVGPGPPIRILVSPEASGTFLNTVLVTSSTADPNFGNNTFTAETTVLSLESFCPTSVTILPIGSELSGTIRWVADGDSFEVFFGEEGEGCRQRQVLTVEREFDYGPLERDKTYEVRVLAHRSGCPSVTSACIRFTVCPTDFTPKLAAVPETHSDLPFRPELIKPDDAELPGGPYVFQLSTSQLFPNDPALTETRVTDDPFAIFIRSVTARTAYYSRARLACDLDGWSEPPVRTVVLPTPTVVMDDPELVGQFEVVEQTMEYDFVIDLEDEDTARIGLNGPTTVTVTTDKGHLTVTPSTVTVPSGGTATVQGGANPQGLPVGTTTGTLVLTNPTTGSTLSTVPVSVTLTTPLVPVSKSPAPDNAMIIPVVTKADGVRAKYRSDLRLLNASTVPINYRLSLTPSDSDGTVEAKQTTFAIEPGQTVAFDDVAEKQFGIGSLGESGSGVLEIRPLDFAQKRGIEPQALEFATVASARSYNDTSTGTFGAFVPGIPFSKAITAPVEGQTSVLSVQHVAQNDRFRSNIGLVEGLGQPVTVLARVFNLAGQKIDEFNLDVPPAGHFHINGILARRDLDVDEVRIEFEVVSGGGKVLAYASVLENSTGDALFVPGTNPADVVSSRFVIPAAIENVESSTDVRLFNASASSVNATLTFYPADQAAAQGTATVLIAPGEVKAIDGVVSSLFGQTNAFGAISITLPTAAPLIVTAHSYTQRPEGIVGQFIEAATPQDAASATTRALQVVQLEESDRFRSDLGLAEVSGEPATVEITATVADSKTESKLLVPLQANEFRQLTSVLSLLNLGRIYNGRVAVRVVGGSGSVFAYGSLVDLQTQDLVFIPGQ